MSTYEKIKKIYSSIGIYNITEESTISYELRAYSAGLDMLCDALSELERECFIPTAESFGLSKRELAFGAVRTDLTAEKRRDMLIKRSSFGAEDFTLKGMYKALGVLGVEGIITEYPGVNRVTVEIKNQGLTKGQRNWIVSQLQMLFPAHLEADAVFSGFSWGDIDNLEQTFSQMESSGKTWSEIDYYCI